jgi:succinoglycan biosynthesis transport protein ExoP
MERMRADSGEPDGWGEEAPSGEFDPRVVLDFLRRRFWVIVLVSVPLLIPATIAPFLLEPFYEATATVAIRTTPKVMEFGQDFMPGNAGENRNFGAGPSEASVMTLALSDAVLGRVADQMPPSGPPSRTLLQRAKDSVTGREVRALTPDQDRAARIDLLRKFILLGFAEGYLRITASSGSSDGATFLANAVADAYVKHQEESRERASRRAIAWLNQQVYELREQAARKEQTLAEIATTNNLPLSVLQDSGDESSTQGPTSVEQVEDDLQEARVELLAAQERLAALRPSTRGTDRDVDRESSAAREQYNRIRSELEVARLRFTPTHPEVRRLENQLRTLGEKLGADAAAPPRVLTEGEEEEYQELVASEAHQRARVRVLEKTRSDLLSSTGAKLDAVGRYRRLAKELAIDKQILEVLMTRRNETLLAAATKEIGAEVLDYAVAPLYPAGPSKKKYLAGGYVLALGLGFGLAFLLELIDRRMRDPDAIAKQLGATSLGMIPIAEVRDAPAEQQAVDAPGTAAGEGYRNLRTSLLFAMRASKIHCLLVTSAIAGEGKTTTSTNLAGAFGCLGRRVILIDADLRRPRVHRVFRLPASPGLSEILRGEARIEDAVVRLERSNFDLLPAGAIPDAPSELLGSSAFAQLIADLKAEYDLVVLDSPVLLAVPDALLLAAEADGTLIVHKPGSVDRRALRRMRDDLARAGARVIGVVFNHVDPGSNLLYPQYLSSPYLKDQRGKSRIGKPRA